MGTQNNPNISQEIIDWWISIGYFYWHFFSNACRGCLRTAIIPMLFGLGMPYPQGVQAYWRSRWTLCTPLAGCGAHGEGSFLSKAWRARSFWPTHCDAQWLTRRRCAKVLLGLSVNCRSLLSAARHGHLPRGQLARRQLPLQKGRPCAPQQVVGLPFFLQVSPQSDDFPN